MRIRNKEDGFTFIEVLMGLVIALFVAGALVSFTRLSFDSHLTVTNSIEEIWDSRQAMNQINEELKFAVQVVPAPDQKSLTFSSLDPSNYENIINNRLYLNGDNLLCIDSNALTRLITKYPVEELICTHNINDPKKMTIDITVVFSDQTTLSTSVLYLNDNTEM